MSMKAASAGSSKSPTAPSCFSLNPRSFDTAFHHRGRCEWTIELFGAAAKTAKGWQGGGKGHRAFSRFKPWYNALCDSPLPAAKLLDERPPELEPGAPTARRYRPGGL